MGKEGETNPKRLRPSRGRWGVHFDDREEYAACIALGVDVGAEDTPSVLDEGQQLEARVLVDEVLQPDGRHVVLIQKAPKERERVIPHVGTRPHVKGGSDPDSKPRVAPASRRLDRLPIIAWRMHWERHRVLERE